MIKLYCTKKKYPTCFVKCAAGYGCFCKYHILLWPTRQRISISIFTKDLTENLLKPFSETKQDLQGEPCAFKILPFSNLNITK